MKNFKDGTPTNFLEKIMLSNMIETGIPLSNGHSLSETEILSIAQNACKISNHKESGLNWDVKPKIHTIRKETLTNRLQKFVGKEIECFYWKDKPYHSKHQVWGSVLLDGWQGIFINNQGIIFVEHQTMKGNYNNININTLCQNDGITTEQFNLFFKPGFKGFIYHFTKFRY